MFNVTLKLSSHYTREYASTNLMPYSQIQPAKFVSLFRIIHPFSGEAAVAQ